MTAWAWGVSRIIDAIESTPDAKLNPAAVGVTGCSRNGKGALMAGALEPLTAFSNLTLIESDITLGAVGASLTSANRAMVGQAPYVVNAGLSYAAARGATAKSCRCRLLQPSMASKSPPSGVTRPSRVRCVSR